MVGSSCRVMAVLLASATLTGGAAFAATVEASAKAGEYRLDPEKGDVATSLTALAQAIGATIVGDTSRLTGPAPSAVMTGTPERLVARLLRNEDYVLKSGASGRINQIVLLSGEAGKDPAQPRVAPPVQSAASQPANSGASEPSVTSSLMRSAQQIAAAQAAAREGLPLDPPEAQAAEKRAPQPTISAQARVASGQSAGDRAARGPTSGTPAPVSVTPEMQAEIAAATQRARAELDTLVRQLREACPPGQTC
ncbi:hypothetical protein GC169_04255 [bacterium]|nr:hypothetical protein [bacterium]